MAAFEFFEKKINEAGAITHEIGRLLILDDMMSVNFVGIVFISVIGNHILV